MSLVSAIHAVRRSLPDGRALSEADWQARHSVMTWVLAMHIPAIIGYALMTGASLVHAVAEAALPAALVVLAKHRGHRLVRSLGVAFGLITCSAVFVHLSEGLIEWHFHYFVTLALVALYQEWRVYLLAVGFVVVQHGVGSWLRFDGIYNHGDGQLWWALVHGAFILAASASHITAWRLNEVATARADAYRRKLQEGEQSVLARLEETTQLRSDLIATASHEFRTPLTVITGAATTLQRHGEALSEAERAELLATIVGRTGRLAQMLESMIIAAQLEPPVGETAGVAAVVDEVLPQPGRGAALVVEVPRELWVACGRRPLAQLVARLVDTARLKGNPAATLALKAVAIGAQVRVEMRVAAAGLDPDGIAGLFEPFRGGTDVIPRTADVGLGLYAVRRIAEAYGGSAAVYLDDGAFVIDVRLPRAASLVPMPRAAAAPVRPALGYETPPPSRQVG